MISTLSLSEPVINLLDELLNEEASSLRFLIQNGEQEESDVERLVMVKEAQQAVAEAQLWKWKNNEQ